MRNFDKWLGTFLESISDYKYYISFDSVYRNTDKFKIELNLLNSLIGSNNIETDFINLITEFPRILNVIPLLLAVRENEISCRDENGTFKYNFKNMNYSPEQYCYFMRETGLFELISKHTIANLYDYATGVNVGLDSNGRKNRGGHLMEDIVESYLKKHNLVYYKEMYIEDAETKFNIDLSSLSNNGESTKRFDFVVKGENCIYGIECNFYKSSGSKLNETARSYKMLAEECKNIDGFKFVWITDGFGWKSAKNNLKETFDVLDNLYNLKDLENGILDTLK